MKENKISINKFQTKSQNLKILIEKVLLSSQTMAAHVDALSHNLEDGHSALMFHVSPTEKVV